MKTIFRANHSRVETLIEQLKKISETEDNLTRTTYSLAWEESVYYIQEEMHKRQMHTRVDGFGNLIGSYNPAGLKSKPIGIGSHIDTVKDGGVYDGGVGIIAGLEIISMMIEENIMPSHPIEVIAFAEEEGSVFGVGCLGSKYMTGEIELEKLIELRNEHQIDFLAILQMTKMIKKPYLIDYGWAKDYYHQFYETHIEQGKRLEDEKYPTASVEGIVGILRNKFTFIGESNHAGTTPMDRRRDASIGAAAFIVEVSQQSYPLKETLVATTGRVVLYPNQHNVIPGKAEVVLEIRGTSDDDIKKLYKVLIEKANQIADKVKLELELDELRYTSVQRFDDEIVNNIKICGGSNCKRLFSWAGHDAKFMSKVTPTGMLFIPSIGGISHSKFEKTSIGDILTSVEILYNVLLKEVCNDPVG